MSEEKNINEISNEDGQPLTAETVSALYPHIANSFRKEGAATELARIKGVKSKTLPGHEEIVEQMMFDGKTTPDQASSKILEAEKDRINQASKNLNADASEVEEMPAEEVVEKEKEAADEKSVDNMIKGANSYHKVEKK